MAKRRLIKRKVSDARDEILTEVERTVDQMTLTQAQEWLHDLIADVENILDDTSDTIQSIRADTKCTCKERGKRALHAQHCAKMKVT